MDIGRGFRIRAPAGSRPPIRDPTQSRWIAVGRAHRHSENRTTATFLIPACAPAAPAGHERGGVVSVLPHSALAGRGPRENLWPLLACFLPIVSIQMAALSRRTRAVFFFFRSHTAFGRLAEACVHFPRPLGNTIDPRFRGGGFGLVFAAKKFGAHGRYPLNRPFRSDPGGKAGPVNVRDRSGPANTSAQGTPNRPKCNP